MKKATKPIKATLAATALLVAAGIAGAQDLKSDTVVFADYGGTTRAARMEAYFKPFEAKTSVRVVPDNADPSKLKLFAENKRADWDFIDLDAWDLIRFARQDALAKLPPGVARNEAVPEEFRDYAAAGYNASALIGYNTDIGRPASWADFFDTEKFPGKRGLPNFGYMVLEGALLADGVPCDKLYPLDFDRAFAKLDKLRPHVLFWDSFGQGMQFLAQKSVSMVLTTNSRLSLLKDQGAEVDLVWEEALFAPWAAAGIPKDAPHPDAAFALADFMAQPEQQAEWSRRTYYGPANVKALDLLDQKTRERLPNIPEHIKLACTIDQVALSEQIDEYNKRYADWLARAK